MARKDKREIGVKIALRCLRGFCHQLDVTLHSLVRFGEAQDINRISMGCGWGRVKGMQGVGKLRGTR